MCSRFDILHFTHVLCLLYSFQCVLVTFFIKITDYWQCKSK